MESYYQRNKEQIKIQRQQYYLQNREEILSRQKLRPRDKLKGSNASLIYKYGITIEDKQRMLDEQGDKCANPGCGYTFLSLSDAQVDHNHKTGQVRGLLCSPCNQSYGLLQECSATILGLLDYHSKYNPKE